MIPLTLAEVAQIVGGRVEGDATRRVSGPVVTDARQCEPGSLYVARRGEHADGHDFVGQAAERAAAGALTDRAVPGLACVVVPDVQDAFAALASEVVRRVPGLDVVAVTGSSGKTSTKDLLAAVLGAHAPTVAAAESFNGEVGVPLTALKVEPSTRFLVLEMGARAIGDLRYLTGIVAPDLAVVLNVGSAHVGQFGSLEVTARAKAELVTGLRPQAVAVLNADDPRVAAMAGQTRARVVTFGTSPGADVRAEQVDVDARARARFVLRTADGAAKVKLNLHGEHHVSNALAVAAVALQLQLSLEQVATALSTAQPTSRWRMQVCERADGVVVVNDAYNANPDSMAAALRALVGMARGRRSWAVLGEMRELGTDAGAQHAGIGRLAAQLGVSRVLAVGAGAAPIRDGARAGGCTAEAAALVPDLDAAYELLAAQLRSGDVVLVKSSRDAGLRWLGDRLAADSGDGVGGVDGIAGAGEAVS